MKIIAKFDLPTPVVTHDTSDRPYSTWDISGLGLTTATDDDELVLSQELGLSMRHPVSLGT